MVNEAEGLSVDFRMTVTRGSFMLLSVSCWMKAEVTSAIITLILVPIPDTAVSKGLNWVTYFSCIFNAQ